MNKKISLTPHSTIHYQVSSSFWPVYKPSHTSYPLNPYEVDKPTLHLFEQNMNQAVHKWRSSFYSGLSCFPPPWVSSEKQKIWDLSQEGYDLEYWDNY